MQNVVIKERGIMNEAVDFVVKNQLKDREKWQKTVEVFASGIDTENGRWRGEYFGKQMRGAALTYAYTKDEELYEILTETVTTLLSKQDELGRFSTYDVEKEFNGWDMWCRKYVLVGMFYYVDICKDKALIERIISACKKHLDYILSKIGDGENKIQITSTSLWWGCVNSCTILEPTVEMYKRTGEERYLDFAKYIISQGGCADCNLVELPLSDSRKPFEYPVTKAYEMMSFYEGLLAYYEVTGEKKYFDSVTRFVKLVEESDITIIGCSGCTHELFDNSAIMQTEYNEHIMQETCVTVTWMRLNRRLFENTGDKKYIDNFEISGLNALYGSLNTEMNDQLCMEKGIYVEGMAFDSYSPLYMNKRGRGIGGYNDFATGGYNGCCVAIGACGIALMPLTAVMQDREKTFINMLFDGRVVVKDKDGKDVALNIQTKYPACGKAQITVEENCDLALYIRKPNWCENMKVNGYNVDGEYCVIEKSFDAGEVIDVAIAMAVKSQVLNGKIAFTYGPLTLASDEQKSTVELQSPMSLTSVKTFERSEAKKGEIVRFVCKNAEGEKVVLADYQSCGKLWLSDKALMTAWFNLK